MVMVELNMSGRFAVGIMRRLNCKCNVTYQKIGKKMRCHLMSWAYAKISCVGSVVLYNLHECLILFLNHLD